MSNEYPKGELAAIRERDAEWAGKVGAGYAVQDRHTLLRMLDEVRGADSGKAALLKQWIECYDSCTSDELDSLARLSSAALKEQK